MSEVKDPAGQTGPEIFDEFAPPVAVHLRKSDKTVVTYMVHESNQPKAWWDALSALEDCWRRGNQEGANQTAEGFAVKNAQADLISLSVFNRDVPVDKKEVMAWGSKFFTRVWDVVQSQNGVTKAAAELEGKDSGNAVPSTTSTTLPNT